VLQSQLMVVAPYACASSSTALVPERLLAIFVTDHCGQASAPLQEEEEEEFITSGNWRGKHNSLSRGAGADQP
jgi:hypothetical protein